MKNKKKLTLLILLLILAFLSLVGFIGRTPSGTTIPPTNDVYGLTLTPKFSVNLVNTNHAVTAEVRTVETNQAAANIQVTFTITEGPNKGLTYNANTNTQGQATFTWNSTTAGTDTLTASINPSTNDTATKQWILPLNNTIPEVPLGTISAAVVMSIALGTYIIKGKIPKP